MVGIINPQSCLKGFDSSRMTDKTLNRGHFSCGLKRKIFLIANAPKLFYGHLQVIYVCHFLPPLVAVAFSRGDLCEPIFCYGSWNQEKESYKPYPNSIK